MQLTYITGGIGAGLGLWTVQHKPKPSLTASSLITIVAVGLLSFIRHALFHHSDASRMHYQTSGQVTHNNHEGPKLNVYQIEVGIANLARAVHALLAVVCKWGLKAQASGFVIFGIYVFVSACFLAASRFWGESGGVRRPWVVTVVMGAYGAMMLAIGIRGVSAEGGD